MADNRIPLAELIDFVSTELQKADANARAKAEANKTEPVLKFVECEIDCAIDVEVKAGGGIHVWVLNLSADAKRTEKNTIKVKYSAMTGLVGSLLAENVSVQAPVPGGKKIEE